MSDAQTLPNRDDASSQRWLQQMDRKLRELAELRGEISQDWKRCANEGHNPKAMKRTLKLRKMMHDDVASEERDTLYYLRVAGVPMSPELLFTDMDLQALSTPKHGDTDWDAEEKGYNAGRNGTPVDDNPYEPGSELFAIWRTYWGKGQASLARTMGGETTVASPARKRATQTRVPGTEHKQLSPAAEAKAARKLAQEPKGKKGPRASRKKAANGKSRASRGAVIADDGVPVY